MVEAAQRDQVVELRLAAVGPVLQVMPFAEAKLVLPLSERRRVTTLRPATFPHELLDVPSRSIARDVNEHRFVRRCRNSRHRAYFRVGDLALREGVRDLGQVLERTGDANLFSRGHRADTALPVQPLCRVGEPVTPVRLLAIELRNQREANDSGVNELALLQPFPRELYAALGTSH
jgi:hypothetical protein